YAIAVRRMRHEDAIARAGEEWRNTFNSISDFVFIMDQNQMIVKTNKAFADLMKMKPEEIEGRKCYELLHGTDTPWENCPFEVTAKTKKPHTEIVEDPRIGVPLLVSTSPIFNKKGEFIGSVHLAKDISVARESERQLRQALEIKSQFVSMVSHELRTPLTAIKEGVGLVADGIAGTLNKKQEGFLGIAKRNVDRLARLINEVLDFQKIEAGKMSFDIRENDINDTVREVVATMGPAAREKGLALETQLDNTLPKARFDRDSIIQVLTNVVDNAIKFTEQGRITISSKRVDNTIRVTVHDTGMGIGAGDMPRLFHSFEQLAKGGYRKTGGTGLGLAISRQIIEHHRGKIWAESAPGEGATFHFVIPIEERRR
ncbi:MAG: PAS domain-containing sensor histidine kinase, partial [Candidatus Aureabacteria bacterium]|nr:PAS domain-containing sensor histidine kinase [Candidatus Auribacterota bacterium]